MKKFLLTCFCACMLYFASAQERTVTGIVTSSEDGSPLPGVNILLKGSAVGTVTDIKGEYALSVPSSGGTLVFTFIGLTAQEIEIGERTRIDVQMEQDVHQLAEVVVTALGIERTKNELAYAAQQVDGTEVSKVRDNNFVNGLSGKVAGLQITRNNSMGGSTNVVIRGAKSLTGNNQALFVVDGVPIDNSNTNTSGKDDPLRNQQSGRGGYDYGNAAADINPDDIASIEVLKGAAATALYGSRAANGVIMITTKKGSKGIGVTVNTGVTVGSIIKDTFASYQNKYGAGYGAYYEDYDGDPDLLFLNRDIDGDTNLDQVVPTSEDASWGAPFDPNRLVYQWNAFDPTSPSFGKATPWVAGKNDPSTFFVTPITTSTSVFVDGGGDKGTFKLGYTKNTENGILPNSELKKDMVNFGSTYNITDRLTAGASINFSKIDGLGRYGTGYDDKNPLTSFREWYQVNVDVKELKDAYFRTRQNMTWNWADPEDLVPIYWDNPYWTRYENYENDSRSRYFGYMTLNYKATDWLNFMGRISLDSYNEFQEERIAVGSISVSEYSRLERRYSEYNYDFMANIDKKLSDNFGLKAVVGTNIRKTKSESIWARTNGGLLIPRLYSFVNSANPMEAPIENYSYIQVNGIFASASLAFKDMLYLDLTARRDKSSTLPKGNNVYYYPSASLGFVFSELLGDVPWLTGAKLRTNYAEVGNTAPALYIQDYYDVPTGIDGTPLTSVNNTKKNPNLKPERTKSFEIGLEMSVLEGRAGFDITYYKTNSVDQIVPLPISRATGYDYKIINAGDIENKGVELTVYGTPVKTTNFSWTVNVNWTRYRNKVLELRETNNLQLQDYQGGVTTNAAIGQPYGTIRGSDFVYLNGQKVVNSSGYYKSTSTSNEIIGNVNPDWIGGINNTFKYKDISLSFLIDTRQGGNVFSLDMYYGLATGLYPETAGNNDLGNPVRSPADEGGGIILPGVKEDGSVNDIRYDATNFGIYGYRRNPAAAFVYDASFVKLRELNITYSLPKTLMARLAPLRSIDISVIGRNLWIIQKNLPYADPEDALSSGNGTQGFQVGSYPTTRNIGFNVKFKF